MKGEQIAEKDRMPNNRHGKGGVQKKKTKRWAPPRGVGRYSGDPKKKAMEKQGKGHQE